jgi:aspartate ammonia-lyase
MNNRIEHDLLGEREVPENAYFGVHTQRALDNFRLSGQVVPHGLVKAIAMVKKAACCANAELGYIPADRADAIGSACDDVIEGVLSNQFPLDALQGGAGTSTNMNCNEVIANRALEYLKREKGDYDFIHPLDHVNLHQSTNDVYPTALKIAAIFSVHRLSDAAAVLQGTLQKKEQEFSGIVTIGRTELQDAVPMSLGGQFSSFAEAIGRDRWRTFKCEERLRVVNIGGTAIGTGLAAPRSYIFLVIEKLRAITGIGLTRGENLMDQTANADSFVEIAGILAAHAATIQKLANDLRMLHSFGEIRLPAVQAGSSIMPGKVNPVICEAAIQAAIKAKSDIAMVTECASLGSLQINEFLPLLGFALLEALAVLTATDEMLSGHIGGITAHVEANRSRLDNCTSCIAAFLPELGYERAQAIIEEYQAVSGKSFRIFLEEKIGKEHVAEILSPRRIMALGSPEKNETETGH